MSGAPAAAPGPQQSGVVPDRDVPLPGDQLRALSAVAPEVSRGPGPWAWLLGVTRRVRGGCAQHRPHRRGDDRAVLGARVSGPSEPRGRRDPVRVVGGAEA